MVGTIDIQVPTVTNIRRYLTGASPLPDATGGLAYMPSSRLRWVCGLVTEYTRHLLTRPEWSTWRRQTELGSRSALSAYMQVMMSA